LVFSPDGRAVPSDDSWLILAPIKGAFHPNLARGLLQCDERKWDGGGTENGSGLRLLVFLRVFLLSQHHPAESDAEADEEEDEYDYSQRWASRGGSGAAWFCASAERGRASRHGSKRFMANSGVGLQTICTGFLAGA
jgi:hypothetical protein